MALYEITQNSNVSVPETTFADRGILERSGLQRLLRDNIAAIAPDTYVLAEEYGEWEDAQRRIDLLCLDRNANIVVVELKRTEDGGHIELQAIRYAAMASKLTFAQATEAHAKFLRHLGRGDDAEAAIDGQKTPNLPKRHLFLQIVRALIKPGVTPDSILEFLSERRLISVLGECSPEEFREKAYELRTQSGGTYDLQRYFTKDDELLIVNGRTYALSNQWGLNDLPVLDKLIARHAERSISYTKAPEEP